MDEGDGGEYERVGSAQQFCQLLLNVRIQSRVPQQARPTRVRAPATHFFSNRVSDLRVEVETQVIAGCEVGQPVLPNPDASPTHLVDHGVEHRIGALQLHKHSYS